VHANQLVLTLQPDEGVSMSLNAKIPGPRMILCPVKMEFLYGTTFLSQSPEAYERLLLDAMRGDATLFTRDDEVEGQWRVVDPIVRAWQELPGPLPKYPAGSQGPVGPTPSWSRDTRVVSALVELGETRRARALCEKLLCYASELELYAEEIDRRSGRQLGNFPQAFSHLALINAVCTSSMPIGSSHASSRCSSCAGRRRCREPYAGAAAPGAAARRASSAASTPRGSTSAGQCDSATTCRDTLPSSTARSGP
jgi:Glucose-6-phosphate dehydrogenase, C-terminal domain/Glycosyl hydrolases family 15